MTGSVFLIQGDDLVEMTERPYDSENVLQTLVARYPNLLAREQVDPNEPRRWLLVTREAGIPDREGGGSRWSLDHLFLDQEGIPTLIEVKRSSDTRIRREVVGQMLDYAANVVAFWPVGTIRDKLEQRCRRDNLDAEHELAVVAGEASPDEYWARVKTNLEARRLRLVFVADAVPVELQRIVEFLNDQMTRTQVIAIEIKRFASNDGHETLVPRVIGQTAAAQQAKSAGGEPSRQWDEESFFAALAERGEPEVTTVARELFDWAKRRELRVWWGRGKQVGAMVPVLDVLGASFYPFTVWTYGRLEISFQYMTNGPFADEEKRRELLAKLNALPGVRIEAASLSRRPSFRLAVLATESARSGFLDACDWFVDEVKLSLAPAP
jgi:hypothetical protein